MLYRRVLITGANGLLGQALVRVLGRHPDYDVLATGLQEQPRFRGGSCGYMALDVNRHDDVKRVFQDFSPDVVVNCAAMTEVDRCETDRQACWRLNVDAVDLLARQCLSSGSRLVQVSTDFVFDGTAGPYREPDRPLPVNFYGKSKLAAENAARGAGIDHWAIVRTALVFGTGERLSRSNIVLWIVDELSRGRSLRMVTDQLRTPTWAPDLARGIERIVRFGKTGIYHVSGREMLSVHELALEVAKAFDFDPSLVTATDGTAFSQPAERPMRTGFIILKAESELGFRPTPLREALARIRAELAVAQDAG